MLGLIPTSAFQLFLEICLACNRLTPTNLHSSLIIAHLHWICGRPPADPSIHAHELQSLIIWQEEVLFSQIGDVTAILCVCVCFRAGFTGASAL